MGIIEINSPKFGDYKFIIDQEDIERCRQYTWSLHHFKHKSGECYYYGMRNKSNSVSAKLLHRFILNAPKESVVDHINRDTFDNRKLNLRLCTIKENTRNCRPIKINNTSGYKGVCWDKNSNKWMAYIKVDYHHKTLGYFDDINKAAQCRQEAELKYFGEYSTLAISQ